MPHRGARGQDAPGKSAPWQAANGLPAIASWHFVGCPAARQTELARTAHQRRHWRCLTMPEGSAAATDPTLPQQPAVCPATR